MNTLDLVDKKVWHWQFYVCHNGRQILAASQIGRISVIQHAAQHQTVTIGNLSVPEDLEYSVKKDHIEIDLGNAHVVLRTRS